jgi:hypothetical protein
VAHRPGEKFRGHQSERRNQRDDYDAGRRPPVMVMMV